MLCKSGDLKKAEIGAIKITEGTTFIEVAPSGLGRFLNAIGPEGKIEKAITARQIDGQPDFNSGHGGQGGGQGGVQGSARKSRGRDRSGKRERSSKPYAPREKVKSYDDRPKKMNKKAKARAAAAAENKEDYQEATVWADDPSYADKPKAKKPHKKKLARASAKASKSRGKTSGKPSKGGDAPPKRRAKTSGKGGAKLKRKPRK